MIQHTVPEWRATFDPCLLCIAINLLTAASYDRWATLFFLFLFFPPLLLFFKRACKFSIERSFNCTRIQTRNSTDTRNVIFKLKRKKEIEREISPLSSYTNLVSTQLPLMIPLLKFKKCTGKKGRTPIHRWIVHLSDEKARVKNKSPSNYPILEKSARQMCPIIHTSERVIKQWWNDLDPEIAYRDVNHGAPAPLRPLPPSQHPSKRGVINALIRIRRLDFVFRDQSAALLAYYLHIFPPPLSLSLFSLTSREFT